MVPEGHYGLLYRDGKYRHRVSPGKHCFWSSRYSVRLVDMRRLTLTVAGEETLSADRVGVKISVVLTYQIIQAETVFHAVRDYVANLNDAVEAAMCHVICSTLIEGLLNQRLDIDAQLYALVQPEADKIGIIVHAVEVKEVMVTGGLKRLAGTPAT